MAAVSAIWTFIQIIAFVLQLALRLRLVNRMKVETDQFDIIAKNHLQNVSLHLEQFGLKLEKIRPAKDDFYITDLKKRLKSRGNSFYFFNGEVEFLIFDLFDIPTENGFNEFARISFMLVNGHDEYFFVR